MAHRTRRIDRTLGLSESGIVFRRRLDFLRSSAFGCAALGIAWRIEMFRGSALLFFDYGIVSLSDILQTLQIKFFISGLVINLRAALLMAFLPTYHAVET